MSGHLTKTYLQKLEKLTKNRIRAYIKQNGDVQVPSHVGLDTLRLIEEIKLLNKTR